ncbi:MAG: integrase arm-type DNA-binding domain-containing protein [Desulfobacterales bacterium]|nr:integrase arm-type DNA-binding domain-containing protein [Desulfobacterales bacterium]MDD4072963.1 integrase arm-type DNA-binding domain-containing protein [Desulfobacterales bacterium]MDD4392272.1 integrase arm-type DNA-binding domain-containing protein [Desulfobacterales bacterium]
MPKRITPLSDTKVRTIKPAGKPQKFFDGGGLFLLVTPTGGKLWRLKYRFGGTEKLLSIGAYPQTSLADARQKREQASAMICNGVDPSDNKKAQKAAGAQETETFEVIAREWHAKFSASWAASHSNKIIRRFELYVFPWLGDRPIKSITALDLLTVLRRIEAKGTLETAHRTQQICGQVFRYAVATGRAERDPSGDLRGAIPPASGKHMATMTDPKEIAGLLRSIDDYRGSIVIRCALQLAPLFFVRPGELRHAEWSEFNLDEAEWRIPAEKMKAGVMHIVPLSRQVLDVLREIHPLTGHGRYVFPSPRTDSRPMSSNAILSALRRMGFAKDEMSGHGFRSMASTLLNEQGWNRDAIERQLAHAERNSVRAAYNYAEFMPERKKMMQAWADYLEGIKSGAKIIQIRSAAG